MPITEKTAKKLVLQSGSTTLTLDKDAGTVSMQRKMLMFNPKADAGPVRRRRDASRSMPASTAPPASTSATPW